MVNQKEENEERDIDVPEENSVIEIESGDPPPMNRRRGVRAAERLRDIGQNEVEEDDHEEEQDLLFQQSDREDNVIQWLQALDLQVIGACRADERLKPFLKLNVSSGATEDRLLSHLIQHFDAAEVGMLARCFFMPLVSLRVGRIVKQGTLLCPTADRGNLNLVLLPSSNLRISFVGDEGCTERLATMSSNCESSAVVIKEISADTSGRSFVLELPGRQAYFWCSEKSKLLGDELLTKMKDLLGRKPSVAELTGISESRLEYFATHLHSFIVGQTVSNTHSYQLSSSLDTVSEPIEFDSGLQISSFVSNTSCQQMSQATSAQPLPVFDDLFVASKSLNNASNINLAENELSEVNLTYFPSSLNFMESVGEFAVPPCCTGLSKEPTSSQDHITTSFLSPYYCWCPCPPCTPTLQSMPISSVEPLSFPPSSSLAYTNSSTSPFVSWRPPFSLPDISSLGFPTFLPDPLVQVPHPISSIATMPISQQIPIFTPLMSDPIVHIPSIGICSSGQGYMIGAAHSISATIAPLHPHIVNPLITDTESMVEKGARETLRFLLGSAQTSTWSMDVLPVALTSTCDGHSMLVSGSRGVYSGTTDTDIISFNDVEDIRMVSPPQRDNDLIDFEKQAKGSGGCSDNVG